MYIGAKTLCLNRLANPQYIAVVASSLDMVTFRTPTPTHRLISWFFVHGKDLFTPHMDMITFRPDRGLRNPLVGFVATLSTCFILPGASTYSATYTEQFISIKICDKICDHSSLVQITRSYTHTFANSLKDFIEVWWKNPKF